MQLGKLRQWAGEVILSRDKTTLSEEFQELERDIELRKDGATKLLAASEAYQYTLAKKKKNDSFEDSEKLLPVDSLGIVMVAHGGEFGDDSAYGASLVKLGGAHRKIAALQEAFALTLKDTFLSSLEKYTGEIKDYETQRKKLESRRLSYDVAVTKFEKIKNGKKDKEKREAEEEMEKARDRYDETSEEVKAQMHAIQNKEMDQLRELTNFLDQEVRFVEQYLNVLNEVRSEWFDESSLMHVPPRRTSAPPHVFPHSRTSPEYEHEISRKLSRSPKSVSSKPPSRPASRSSRKRADSGATAGEKDEKDKASKRTGVAGWASSAMDSMTGRGKKNLKDKEQFSSLDADFEGESEDSTRNSPSKKSGTFHSLTRRLSSKSRDASPVSTPKILKPPYLLEKRLVRATQSFSGGVDELSFISGEEITVLNEVLDDWWMGELNGKKGLFPTSCVEVVTLNPRHPKDSYKAALFSTVYSSKEDATHDSADGDSITYSLNDFDDDHDFERKPLSAHHTAAFLNGPSDGASVISSLRGGEDDLIVPFSGTAEFNGGYDDHFQMDPVSKPSAEAFAPHLSHIASPPSFPRRATETAVAGNATSGKKPPPPPPRRLTTNALGPSPPIPERQYKMKALTLASSMNSHDRSPFESVAELSTPDAQDNKCEDFKQSPYQANGICRNCFQLHG